MQMAFCVDEKHLQMLESLSYHEVCGYDVNQVQICQSRAYLKQWTTLLSLRCNRMLYFYDTVHASED